MSYFIFDLDETLAEIYTVYYFVASLQTYPNMSKELTASLKKAYKKFVKKIVKDEITNPLGIVRPGILHVMKRLHELYKIGKVKNVIIYSNNGHLYTLEFIRDVINKFVGYELIRDCIHRYHPMRKNDTKTWHELEKIITKGEATNLMQDDVYFFDDLEHEDLRINIDNYYKVPEYTFKASFDRIANIYRDVLSNVDKEFMYIVGNEKIKNIDDVIEIFRNETQHTELIPPEPDEGIDMMMDAIQKVEMRRKKLKR